MKANRFPTMMAALACVLLGQAAAAQGTFLAQGHLRSRALGGDLGRFPAGSGGRAAACTASRGATSGSARGSRQSGAGC